MEESILKSVKKSLGLSEDYEVFDPDIIMHINSAFSILNQLGVGPLDGYSIEDDTSDWVSFIGDDPRVSLVRTYVYMKVRLLFDPPATGYLVTSMENMIKESEWRLNSAVEVNQLEFDNG